MPDRISRRSFLKASGTAGAAGALAGAGTVAGAAGAAAAPDHHVPRFPFEEATIAELQAAMTAGRLSSRRLTRAYLDRMPPTGALLVVGGPRNRAGSGAPSTILGLVP